jgi:type IV pilus assembly protein PilB
MTILYSASNKRLVRQLLDDKVISLAQSEKYASLEYARLLRLLWETEGVDQEALARAVAVTLHLPYMPGHALRIDEAVHSLLGRFDGETAPLLPMCKSNGAVHIAVSDPFDLELKDRLEAATGDPVELVIASPTAIRRVLHESAAIVSRLDSFSRDAIDGHSPGSNRNRDDHLTIDENSAPIVKLVNTLLREAVAKKASDIHIENHLDKTLFRYRIDGVLRQAMEPLEMAYQEALISRIKVMSELDITERHVPQDGRFRLTIDHSPIDFRVSILPGLECEDAVIRILDSRSIPGGADGLRLLNLGMAPGAVAVFQEIIANPSGMIVVTGPTGSGKTTTLYAALNELDQHEGKTITIEDPIEYRLPGVLQVPVNEKKKLTFSRGLRSILRHDPDRIMIGEIRDRETAEIAVQSSLTGHLLFTTIHANTPLDVINRFTHMGIAAEVVVPSLACIMSQRLLRKLCPHCKAENATGKPELEAIGLDESTVRGWHIYDATGCESCGGTGYSGRTVVTEIIRITPKVAKLLVAGADAGEVTRTAQAEGAVSLKECALEKIREGITSAREVKRVLGSV